MKKVIFCLWILIGPFSGNGQSMQPIGQWRAYVPFGHGIQVDESGGNIFYATKHGLGIYNPTAKESDILTKSQGLSDLPIQFIKSNPAASKVLVVYENANMDLLSGNQTKNIPDIYLKQTTAFKHIYDALWIGDEIYLSTSLGIVVVNALKNEIKDTYKLMKNGLPLEVYSLALNNGILFAATSKGIQKSFFNISALSDPLQWSSDNSLTVNSSVPQKLITWKTDLIATRNDSVFVSTGQSWTFIYACSLPINSIRLSNSKLVIVCRNGLTGKIFSFQSTLNSPQSILLSNDALPNDAIDVNGAYWVADQNKGLVRMTNGVESNFTPDAPLGLAMGQTIFQQDRLFACSGGMDANGLPLNNTDGVFVFDGNAWKNFNEQNTTALAQFTDATALASDLISGKLYVGSYGKGMASISSDGKITRYASNSFLSPALTNASSFNINGLALDQSQNLWILCDGASQGLCVLKKDGTFKKFSIPFTYADLRVSKLLIDISQKIWIVSSKGNGLFCFDFGGTIDQVNDDKWRYFRAGSGSGNLPSANVNCVVSDRNEFVWVGTDKGIGIIQCGDDVFASTCQATIPIVQQDNYAGPLFGEENILDIEVDGANRKWVATAHGVWLISADGQKVVNKFTAENSPLLNSYVNEIAIDPISGEVFFMTAYGICSYRGTATEPVTDKQRPIIFPNPVQPGYNGSIAIKGLPENAWVRITELDGKLVYQTRSLGGQAIWNGKTYKGDKIRSGVYLVMVSDELNTFQVVTKIFFIK